MKLPRRPSKRSAASFDARLPHPFMGGTQPGTVGVAVGHLGTMGTTGLLAAAGTGHLVRTSACVVPGCGKPPADDIHRPAD